MTIRLLTHAYRRLLAGAVIAVLTAMAALAAGGPAGAATLPPHRTAAAPPSVVKSLVQPPTLPPIQTLTKAPHPTRRLGVDGHPPSNGKAAAPADATGPMTDHGGPVQAAPKVYIDFWDWTSDPSGERPYLERFLSAAGGTPWLNVVNQYNAFSASGLLAGVWSDLSPIPANPSIEQVQQEAANAASHFAINPSVNVQIVVATPAGNDPQGFPDTYCAEHSSFIANGGVATFTLLPYQTDAPTCFENRVNPGAAGLLDGVSISEGHELAETMTDPLGNGWFTGAANGGEIGDLCVTKAYDITTIAGTFAVQALWNNASNGCLLDTSSGPDSYETAVTSSSLDLQTVGYDNIDWHAGVASVTSPAITPVATGGFVAAYQGTNGDLWVAGVIPRQDTGLPMTPGSSPAVTSLLTGGYEVAFQGANGDLWLTGTAGTLDLAEPMMAGTTPSITRMLVNDDGGGYEVAFEGSNSDLWTFGNGSPATDTGYGMATYTSPSIADLNNDQVEIAFQANTGSLWTVGASNNGAWNLGMALRTSPAITALPSGSFEVAFQANTGSLWTVGAYQIGALNLGMAGGSSPAITALPDGTFEAAFQANTASLWTTGGDQHGAWNLGMFTNTSPAIAW
jgi:hypothetical protein